MSESKPGFKISWKSWLALLAVVGIIFVVGIASYGDYIHLAQASEATGLIESFKGPLEEHFQKHGKWPDTLDKIGGPTDGKYTQSVAITKGAGGAGELELTATMRIEGVNRRVAGHTVILTTGDGGKSWICRPGTMPEKYLKTGSTCRLSS